MKKKSLVGYTAKDWLMKLRRGKLLDFNYVQHSAIYRTAFTDSLKEEFYTKVKITIEEL